MKLSAKRILLSMVLIFLRYLVFFDADLLTREDARAAYGELRFQSIGWHMGEMLFVVWTPGNDEWPHIISARKAEKHECEAWTRFCK